MFHSIHIVFVMGTMLTRLLSSMSPSTAQFGVIVKSIKEQTNNFEVCDESDKTGNWFIYCNSNILAAVNIHQLESDPKTFVDRPLKTSPDVVLEEFLKKFGEEAVENINPQELLAFRERYFDKEGEELEKCTLPEWEELPPKIARIKDEALKNFAIFLNKRWRELCRQVKSIKYPERHSLIIVPKPFIVPGGRFREFYYWDAYWIVKGLIACNLFKMVKNMLTNFLYCVQKFGFVPNGGRVYYLRRSQPPFLIPMVYEYYQATKDTDFIKKNFKYLVKEFEFWIENRSLVVMDEDGNNHTVYQYRTTSNIPRPEAYRFDIEAAMNVKKEKRQKFFQDIASAAESGWDFSSRWFRNRQTIESIETTDVVPVDLNALLCWNANILKYLAGIAGDTVKVAEFEERKHSIWEALNSVFYNNTEKAWFDYNLRTKSHNTNFYPSIVMPLFTQCYPALDYEKSAEIVDFMNRSGLFEYQNGIPTSLERNSGEKWDFPNGWAPLQHIIIEGLRKSINPDAQEMACPQVIKIDIIGTIPKPGSGGEYNVQDGFGWTNGVILDLLATYYDRMTTTETSQKQTCGTMPPVHRTNKQLAVLIIFVIITDNFFSCFT
uniref:Trehalase n=1 Tax=Setaria digitata TaxID=48799 RepID=A0A915Q1G6_9BILA